MLTASYGDIVDASILGSPVTWAVEPLVSHAQAKIETYQEEAAAAQ